MRSIEDTTFLFLIIAVSIAFAWILWPLQGAVLWGTVTAIVFAPLYRRLSRSMQQRQNLAALVTVLIILLVVILPLTLIAAALVQEASGVYERIQSGDLDLVQAFQANSGHLARMGSQSNAPFWADELRRGAGEIVHRPYEGQSVSCW